MVTKTRKRRAASLGTLKTPEVNGAKLQRWRRAQLDPETGEPATMRQAADWFGCSLRAWQYYEAAGTPAGHDVPMPLRRRLALGHKIFEGR